MKPKKYIALLLAVAVLLSLAACAARKEEKDISGFYVLTSATIGDEEVDADDLAWKDYDLFVWLREDGDAVFFNGTALIYGTWKNGKLITDDDQALPFSVDGRTLTLTAAEGELIFKLTDRQTDLDELQKVLDTPREIGYFLFERTDREDFGGEGAFVLLYADGTGWLCNGKRLTAVTWKDGELYISAPEYSIDVEVSYPYTATDDELTLTTFGFDGAGSPIEYNTVFRRTDEAEPDIDALKNKLASPSGYFVLSTVIYGETTIDMADLADFYEVMPFLIFCDDGTGSYYDSATLYDLTWDDESICVSGETVPYTFYGTALTLAEEGIVMLFEHSDEEAPELDALRGGQTASGDAVGTYRLYMAEVNGERTDELLDAVLTLSEDRSTTYVIEGKGELTGTWNEESIVIGTVTYSYTVDSDGTLTLSGSDGIFYFTSETVKDGFWTNDWYGWWMIEDATGDYADYAEMWWDLCASSEDYGEEGYIVFWDEDDNSCDDPIGEMTFTHGETTFSSDYGWFWCDEWEGEKELTCDLAESPVSDMLILSGTYTDEDGSITYTLCLRPWGVKWDDLDSDVRPYYYDTWYLPLIEDGKPLPKTFEP